MTPAAILLWADLGVKLITVLAVPIASVIKLFKDSGGTDEEAALLVTFWANLTQSIEQRIAYLKAQGAGG